MVPERLRPVVEEIRVLTERFLDAGHSLYLVGGTVRDAIVGRPGGASAFGDEADIDCTTDALPETIEALVSGIADALWVQGKRFGTIGMSVGGRKIEITTHRAEAYRPDSRKPDVAFGNDITADLSRRDFTVNAMALRLSDLELIDPFNGLGDLVETRTLRTPLSPAESFSDDPLRMLRAARFISGYGLEPEGGLVDAVVQLVERLSIVAAERIRDEFDKLMMLPDPQPGLWFVVRTGLAGQFLPELPALELEQDPIQRHKDVLAHTIAVVGKTHQDLTLRLAALFHDVGKPRTRAYVDGGVTFHHHDVVGARITRSRMTAMKYPVSVIDSVCRLVELHLRFHTYKMGWTDSALRRYARDAGDLLERLNELTRADCTTRNINKVRELESRMDDLEVRLADLRQREEIEAIRPELDGEQVMKLLKIGPGRDVGQALAYLLEVRLDEGLLGEQEIKRRLISWWTETAKSS